MRSRHLRALDFSAERNDVHRANERTWRRNDRAPQRWTDRLATSRARVDVRFERGAGNLSSRGVPGGSASAIRPFPGLSATRFIFVRPDGEWRPRSIVRQPTITLSIQGGPVARRNRRRAQPRRCRRQSRRGVRQISPTARRRHAHGQYAALVIGVGKALTERTHLARARARRAADAHLGSGAHIRNRASDGRNRSISTPRFAT